VRGEGREKRREWRSRRGRGLCGLLALYATRRFNVVRSSLPLYAETISLSGSCVLSAVEINCH
jgi:hypothetical protein